MEIWQTYRNADDVEGRGPMVPDLSFLHKEHAEEYIDAQPGVMGRKAKWSQENYGDWAIRRIEVLEQSFIQTQKEERKAEVEEKLNALVEELDPEDIETLQELVKRKLFQSELGEFH